MIPPTPHKTHPTCEWCPARAQYDFVSNADEWRYGCTMHWMENRRTKQLGPGHAINLEVGKVPPKRPEGAVAPALLPPRLAKPSKPVAASGSSGGGGPGNGTPRAPRVPRAKGAVEFYDMEPGEVGNYVPRPGSTIAVALELTEREAGATLGEIQAELDKLGKHDALKLLEFMNGNKGYGFKKGENGETIHRWVK